MTAIISVLMFLGFPHQVAHKIKGATLDTIENQSAYTYQWAALADSLQNKLQTNYLSPNGKYYMQDNSGNQTFHYWHNAHAVDVLVDAFDRTGDDKYMQRVNHLLNGIKETNPARPNTYLNNFFDDMGWLGLSTLRAYKVSKNKAQLAIVKTLLQEILTGINDIEGRSLAWAKHRLHFKNTPANGPAIILGLRLSRATGDDQYKDTAVMLYEWLCATLVDPSTGIVWDGINPPERGGMEKAIYTYNQGLFIGAALEMYEATKDRKYLHDAVRTAKNSMRSNRVSPGGILKAEGQGDGGLFKGIFVRYFAKLAANKQVDEADRKQLKAFLVKNAETMYAKGMNHQTLLINYDWNQMPPGTIDLSTQLSGMMLAEAMAVLEKG